MGPRHSADIWVCYTGQGRGGPCFAQHWMLVAVNRRSLGFARDDKGESGAAPSIGCWLSANPSTGRRERRSAGYCDVNGREEKARQVGRLSDRPAVDCMEVTVCECLGRRVHALPQPAGGDGVVHGFYAVGTGLAHNDFFGDVRRLAYDGLFGGLQHFDGLIGPSMSCT